jgi:hypothetical protein
MSQQDPRHNKMRSAFRMSMIAGEPVYMLLSLGNEDIDPMVEELGAGGARLWSSKHFDRFYEGQMLGPAVLVLQDVGMPVVFPVVIWKSWPAIGVQFVEIAEREKEMIFKFLFKLERKKMQPAENRRRRL